MDETDTQLVQDTLEATVLVQTVDLDQQRTYHPGLATRTQRSLSYIHPEALVHCVSSCEGVQVGGYQGWFVGAQAQQVDDLQSDMSLLQTAPRGLAFNADVSRFIPSDPLFLCSIEIYKRTDHRCAVLYSVPAQAFTTR
jgi:hypothetical protein